jgi:hypothetical protein
VIFQMKEGAVETASAGFDEGDRSKGEPFIKTLYTSLTVLVPGSRLSASVKMTPEQCRDLGDHLLIDGPAAIVRQFSGDGGEAPVLVECSRCGSFLARAIDLFPFGCPRCKCPVMGRGEEGALVLFVRGHVAELAASQASATWYPLRRGKGT